MSSVDFHQIL